MLAFIAFILLLEMEANFFLWLLFVFVFGCHYVWRLIKRVEKTNGL